jgi:tetratricopeptide (TPR) repeat protein
MGWSLRGFAAAVLALALLTAGAAMPVGVRAQTSGEISNDAELQKAYDAAFAAMMADPQSLDKTFTFAELAARKGDLEGAVSALERMLFVNPDLPRVKLELGVLYFRLGSYETARAYLQSALDTPDVPQAVRERADTFLSEIDRRASVNRLTGSLFGGLRVQSNANAAPSGTSVMANGLASNLSSNFTKKGDFNLFAAGSMKDVYDFQDQNRDTMEATLSAYSARQQSQTLFNLSFFELTVGPRIPVPSDWLWRDGSLNMRLYAIYDYVDLHDDPYYRAPGAGYELLSQIVPGTVLQTNFEARDKHYQNSGILPLNNEQTGVELLGRAQVIQAINDQLAALFGATFSADNAQIASQAYHYYDYSAGLTWSFDAPFRLTELPWSLTGTATRAFYVYDRPDPSVDPFDTRFDRDWRFAAVSTIPLDTDWSVVTTIGRTIRQSSISNYQFGNDYASIGVSWRF